MGVYSGKVNGGKLDGHQAVTGGSLNPRGQLVGGAIQTPEHFGVSSWNGETGDVTYTAPVTSVNGQTGDVIVTGGVTSVNGEVGDVVLDASDVGALPDDTTYVSSFNGQSGAVTYTAPVSSVNSKTGAVTLNASDVGALPIDTPIVSSVNGQSGIVTVSQPLVLRGSMSVTLNPAHGTGSFTLSSGDPSEIPNNDTVYIVSSSNLSTDDIVLQKNRYSTNYYAYFTTTFRTSLGSVYVEIIVTPDDEGDWNYARWDAQYWVLQDKLTFDSTPTVGSSNPVTSSGIRTAINNINVGVTSVNGNTGAVTVSEMPSATGEADGTALVAVNGEWTKQTGYGYRQTVTSELMNRYFNSVAFQPFILSDAFAPINGSSYDTIYDDVAYNNLTAFSGTVQGYGDVIAIGNGQFLGLPDGDPTCPFCYAYIGSLSAGGIVTMTDGDHHFIVNGTSMVIRKMNGDYIIGEDMNGVEQEIDGSTYTGMPGAIRFFPNGNAVGIGAVSFNQGCAIGFGSVAMGFSTTTGDLTVAEGQGSLAQGDVSHAEGMNTQAIGVDSHSEGEGTIAFGSQSHSEGFGTVAYGFAQHAFGKYNLHDYYNEYIEIAGNGSAENDRSNARTLDWSGNEVLAGKLTVGANPTNNMDVVTKGYGEGVLNAHRAQGIFYGQVDNTSTATAFTATIPGITEYFDGLTVMLKNGVVTSASGFTININGLGAKQSYNNMASATADTTLFNVAYTMLFVYDSTRVAGGGWICYRGYDANTNTIGYQLRTNSSTLPASAKFYRYRLLFTSADGMKWVPANTSTSTNATASRTVNQTPIDPFGEIVYYGTTTAIEANANVTAAQLWQEYTLSLGYSFNRTGAALVLPYPRSIYVKCAPQADGSAIIDSTTPYVTALPSTKDGKIYIYLGRTYSATQIELTMNHPVYYHDGNGIKLWSGSTIPTKTSELTNDSGFLTSAVTSVNGNTGAVTGLQTTSNLVTSVSSASTDTQYPSAKLLYDTIGDIETLLQAI